MKGNIEMANELATQQEFTEDQVQLIKSTVAKGATDDELKLFLYQAKRTGLDPLAKQIHFTKRNSKMGPVVTIITAIDGFRVIAERSGDYAGQDEPTFEKVEGFNGKDDIKCTVKVYRFSRTGERYVAAVGVAYWSEYCPSIGQDFMWKKMPRTMLSKVAEALALRKAFPQDLSGVYTSDEMEQASPSIAAEVTKAEKLEYDPNDDFGVSNAKRKVKGVSKISNHELMNDLEDRYGKKEKTLEEIVEEAETILNA